MSDKLKRIEAIGFSRVGHWKLSDADGGLAFELYDLAATPNVLYAFVVNAELMYVGKTVQPLRTRMNGYRFPSATQSTNIKNNKNIQECLAQGKRVEILAFRDNGLLRYGGFHVNLAAGLEDSLIRDLAPPWNGGKKESPDESLEPTTPA